MKMISKLKNISLRKLNTFGFLTKDVSGLNFNPFLNKTATFAVVTLEAAAEAVTQAAAEVAAASVSE